MMPTDLTVPKIFVALPEGVISACRPFFSWGRSALPTLASTTHEVVEITTIWAVEEDEEDAGGTASRRKTRRHRSWKKAREAPFEETFPTLSPTAMFTCATVPAIGEVWMPQSGQFAHR